jgi:hypothetical protein
MGLVSALYLKWVNSENRKIKELGHRSTSQFFTFSTSELLTFPSYIVPDGRAITVWEPS